MLPVEMLFATIVLQGLAENKASADKTAGVTAFRAPCLNLLFGRNVKCSSAFPSNLPASCICGLQRAWDFWPRPATSVAFFDTAPKAPPKTFSYRIQPDKTLSSSRLLGYLREWLTGFLKQNTRLDLPAHANYELRSQAISKKRN